MLRYLGYEINPYRPLLKDIGGAGWRHDLRRLRFCPGTVFDIGVGEGTAELYQTYPNAYFMLVEPLKTYKESMNRVLRHVRGEQHSVALGATSSGGVEKMLVYPCKQQSSIKIRTDTEGIGENCDEIELPVTTLDDLVEGKNLPKPFGLKIDTEGYEKEIIQGAKRVLRDTEFVIAEVSVASRFEEGYACDEFIELMYTHGFSVVDIIDIGYGVGKRVIFFDMVFQNFNIKSNR